MTTKSILRTSSSLTLQCPQIEGIHTDIYHICYMTYQNGRVIKIRDMIRTLSLKVVTIDLET